MKCTIVHVQFFNNFTMCCFQGTIATMLTQPLDVLKTRAMNAKPGKSTLLFLYLAICTLF